MFKPNPDVVAAREKALAEMQNTRTSAMLMVLAEEGITLASYTKEVRAVAGAAAEQGDFSAAMKGYELIGKSMGAFAPEVHHHVLTRRHEDLARLSDAELERLAYEDAKPVEATVLLPPPEINTPVSIFCPQADEGDSKGAKELVLADVLA